MTALGGVRASRLRVYAYPLVANGQRQVYNVREPLARILVLILVLASARHCEIYATERMRRGWKLLLNMKL